MKLIDALENIRRKHRSRLEKWHADDGEWVTIKGTHVEIDDETGAITKGPERLKTMNKPERGLASAGKKVLGRIKEKMSALGSELEKQKNEYYYWNQRRREYERHVESCKQYLERKEAEAEEQRRIIAENYPEGKEFYEKEKKRLNQELQEKGSFLYDDEHKEERRALSSEERQRLYDDYNSKFTQLGVCTEALSAYNLLGIREQRCTEEKQELKETENLLSDLMTDDSMLQYQKKLTEYDGYAEQRNKAVLKVFPNPDACNTSSDVTEYLQARGYFKKDEHAMATDQRVKLDSMDTETAKRCAQKLDRFMTDYPGLIGYFGGIDCHDMSKESGHENSYAYCDTVWKKAVSYNEEMFRQGGTGPESYARDVRNKFHPPGTDHTSIIDHEFTHAVEELIKEKRGGRANVANLIMKRAMIAVDGEYSKDREQDVREALSGYAGDNRGVKRSASGKATENPNYGRNTEFIAEAMAEARNSPNPRPYAVAVRKEMEKLMKEVGLL